MGEVPHIVLQAPLGDSVEWLRFRNPVTTLVGNEPSDVLPILQEIDAATERGLYAAGFLSYEAAPAFDAAMRVRPATELPHAWFGLFEKPEVIEPPVHAARWRSHDELATLPGRGELPEAIDSIHRAISRGDTYQINYTFPLEAPFEGDAWTLFASLVRGQQSRCCAFVDIGRWALCSASPELFFRLEADRIVSRPMKGTAPRGRTLEEDERSAAWLRASPKNRAENVMIVDMMRHDLGRIATAGSVRGHRPLAAGEIPFAIPTHLDGRSPDPGSALRDLPGPVPVRLDHRRSQGPRHGDHRRARDASPRRLHRSHRLLGTGAKGPIQCRHPHRPGRSTGRVARYGTGGGIVAESEADEEWEEALTKSLVLASPPPTFRLLETIRWDPEEGFSLLQRHLSRLERSAEYFDFRLELRRLERQLHEASEGWLQEAHRVRLLVDSAGEVEIEAEPLTDDHRTWRLALAREPIDRSNRFLFHKTTHREVYDRCKRDFPDHDDVVLWNEEGEITETTIANLVLRLEGELITPALDSGLLPGTLRERLLAEEGLHQGVVTLEDLQSAEEIFLINSVRGWIPATLDQATLETREDIPA